MKIFKKSVWVLSTVFFGVMFGATIALQSIGNQYAGQINSYLNINPYEKIDDSKNETPEVDYYKSDFIRNRYVKNPDTGLYEYQTKKGSDAARNYSKKISKQVNDEGSVLLWNNNSALPLQEGNNISLFGISQERDKYLTTGEGSGYHAMNSKSTLQGCLEANGLKVNPDLSTKYEMFGLSGKYGHKTSGNPAVNDQNYVQYTINEVPYSEIEETVNSSIQQYGDAAIYTITRKGSENGDTDFSSSENINNNYQDLSTVEADNLDHLKSLKEQGKIKKIILILNTSNAMQFNHIDDYPIDACLWTGNGGTMTFESMADILSGKVSPSGHLSDTYLYDSYSSPSTLNMGDHTFKESKGLPARTTYSHNNKYIVYQEGIYVGYKYYETRYEDMVLNQGNAKGSFGAKNSNGDWAYNSEVIFPFGHGESYATFKKENFKVVEKGDSIICSIDITNTSDSFSGKDTFQVYITKTSIVL